MRNLITDVPGVLVGSAHDERVASGATVVVFETPAVGAIATPGGAPALRDGALLAPEMTVETVDAFVLSGGSAFGLDASGGAMAYLASVGRGLDFQGQLVPIAPGAALFDLTHGGERRLWRLDLRPQGRPRLRQRGQRFRVSGRRARRRQRGGAGHARIEPAFLGGGL